MSNLNPGNFYLNTDRYGSEIPNGGGAPDFNPTPVSFIPTASGNTTNLNSFVIDPNGDIWFIDEQGDAVKINTSQTVTTITDTVTGNKIATFTNESGTAVDINETVTVLGDLTYDSVTGLLTIPYTDEAGVVNSKTVTISSLDVLTTAQPTPTLTGNTTNLNSAFKDTAGNTWIVDANGDAVQAGNTPFKNLNEFHVDPNGNDTTGDGSQEKPYATITKALTVAGQGDQIIVHAGTYTENVTISTPNVSLVGAQSDWGSLTQINGSISVTASGTSVKIADLTVTSISDTGTGDLYLNNVSVNSTLTSTAGYLEIRNSRIQDGTITKSGGSMLIEQTKIDNVSITGVNTAAIIRNSYQDGNSTVTYGAGTIYGIHDVQGGEVSINASAIPLETAALAQGLSAEMAKEAETSDFQKIGMIRPDSEASPTKVVTWDEVTGRLEVSTLASINTGAPVTISTDTPTGTSIEGAIHLVTDDGTPTGTVLEQYIYDADSGVWVEMQRNAQDTLKFGTSSPTSPGEWDGEEFFVTSTGTSSGTVLEQWIWDKQSTSWIQRPTSAPELVEFGLVAPTSTTGYTAGDEFFVTSDGTSSGTISAQYIFNGTSWTLRPTPVASLITTSITPKVYQGSSYVNAQANLEANVTDLIQLSDGSYIHDGEVTWTGHGLTVGAWYYLDQTTAGGYTTTKPTTGLVQQLFFVEDANTIHVDIEEAWTVEGTTSESFAKTVYVDATSPSTATIFDLNNPPTVNDDTLKADDQNIYIGTDGSTWTYNTSTSTYSTYVFPATTPLVLHAVTTNATSVIQPAQTIRENYSATLLNTFGSNWNATTGRLTIPRAGYYNFEAAAAMNRAWVAGDFFNIFLFVNGLLNGILLDQTNAQFTGTYIQKIRISRVLQLNAGDIIDVRLQNTGTSSTTAGRPSVNYFIVSEIK
jgi:hypothetical protein